MIHTLVPGGIEHNLVFEPYGFAFNEYYDPKDGYFYPTHNERRADVTVTEQEDSVTVESRGWVSRSGRDGDMVWTNVYTFYKERPEFSVSVRRTWSSPRSDSVRDNSVCFILDERYVSEHRLRNAEGTIWTSPASGSGYGPLRLDGAGIGIGVTAEMVGVEETGVRITVVSFRDEGGPAEFRVIEGEGYSEIEFEWSRAVWEGKVEEGVFVVEVLGWK